MGDVLSWFTGQRADQKGQQRFKQIQHTRLFNQLRQIGGRRHIGTAQAGDDDGVQFIHRGLAIAHTAGEGDKGVAGFALNLASAAKVGAA
jgi:hypothetical protein